MSVKELISKFEMFNDKSFSNDDTDKTSKPIQYIKSSVNTRVEPLIKFWEGNISKFTNIVKIDINKQSINNKKENVPKQIATSYFIGDKNNSFENIGTEDLKETNKMKGMALGANKKNIEVSNKRERLRSRMATIINWPSKS